MKTTAFSPHLFWSYKKDANLSDTVIIRQVIAYGEISDFRKISNTFRPDTIREAIATWKSKGRHKKHINFLEKVFLDD